MDSVEQSRQWSVLDCLLISFFAVSIPSIWVPLTIYLGNTSMFMISITELTLWLFSVSAVGTLIVTLLLLCLPQLVRGWGIRLAFALGLLLWLQANVFAWRMGVLDGSELKWSPTDIRGLVDISAWILLLPILFYYAARWHHLLRTIIGILILIQLAATTVGIVSVNKEGKIHSAISIDGSTKFTFSPDRNVIILVLDSFETILFHEMLEKDPSLVNVFDGFTYYPNIVGGYQYTSVAMPLILTGKYYDNLQPYADYIRKAYSGDSIPRLLKANGFRSEFYTGWDGLANSGIYVHPSIVDNVVPGQVSAQKALTDLEVLYGVDLFRLVPYLGKKTIHEKLLVKFPKVQEEDFVRVYQESLNGHPQAILNLLLDQLFEEPQLEQPLFQDRDDFILSFQKYARATLDRPAFKYYHLVGTHAPLYLNNTLVEDTPETVREIADILIYDLVKGFLKTLQTLAVYDNSEIFILGDHGRHTSIDFQLPEKYAQEYPRGRFVTNDAQMGRAFPMLLHKPMKGRGPLQTSMVPVTLADIAPTVFNSLGISAQTEGMAIQYMKEDTVRTRRYFNMPEYKPGPYMAPMEEYAINGFSWIDASWHETDLVYANGNRTKISPKLYPVGTPLHFGYQGSILPFLASGWNYTTQSTEGNMPRGVYAKVRLPIEKQQRGDLILSAQITPLAVSPSHYLPQVHVFINEIKLGVWNITKEDTYRLIIPQAMSTDGDLNICFEFPDNPKLTVETQDGAISENDNLLFRTLTVGLSTTP